MISLFWLSFSTFHSSNERNWFEAHISLPSQTLMDVAAQIISGFISFGTLHIRTTGFEPWQWYEQV
jgi:hypothetical protein